MTYDELKILNLGTPSKELCEKAIAWAGDQMKSYMYLYHNYGKNRTMIGKCGHYGKIKKSFERQYKELYGNK